MNKIILLSVIVLASCSSNKKVKYKQEAPMPPAIGNDIKTENISLTRYINQPISTGKNPD